MARQRPVIIFGLAVVSALVAGFAAVRYSAQQPTQAVPSRDGGGAPVVVAARDLPVGHFITDTDLQVIRWPDRAVPAGYVSDPAGVVGRGLTTSVRMNGPILEPDLAERGSGSGMPIIFPEGMRAVSVRVDDVVAVAGFVTPRTRVDVLLTMRPPTGSEQTYTQIILQNLLVLAAGQTVQQDERGQPMTVGVVTLMVTPEQAEKLVLAAGQGRIQLALRNMVDVDSVRTAGIGDARLLEIGRQPAPRTAGAAAPRPRTTTPEENVMEVFRGGVRSLQRF
jgi:pilus assembly protein CpaB